MADVRGASVRLVTPSHDSAMDDTADAARVLLVDAAGAPIAVLPVSGTVSVSEPVSVDDNGGSITVDAPVGTPAFVRLSDGAAAITTLPVSLASVPSHAVTATDLDIRDLTSVSDSVQALGNVASGATDSGNPVKAGGVFNTASPTLTNGQRGDVQLTSRAEVKVAISNAGTLANIATPADGQTVNQGLAVNARLMSYNGSTADLVRGDTTNGLDVDVTRVATGQGKTLLFAAITQGAAGTTQLVAADATKKVKVVSYVVVMDAAGSFKFTDGTADLTGVMPVAANGGVSIAGQPSSHLLETAAVNRALNIVTVTGKAFGHIAYFLEA